MFWFCLLWPLTRWCLPNPALVGCPGPYSLLCKAVLQGSTCGIEGSGFCVISNNSLCSHHETKGFFHMESVPASQEQQEHVIFMVNKPEQRKAAKRYIFKMKGGGYWLLSVHGISVCSQQQSALSSLDIIPCICHMNCKFMEAAIHHWVYGNYSQIMLKN